jgi:hypothetical protein
MALDDAEDDAKHVGEEETAVAPDGETAAYLSWLQGRLYRQ